MINLSLLELNVLRDLEVDSEEFAEGNGGQDTHARGQGQHQPEQRHDEGKVMMA